MNIDVIVITWLVSTTYHVHFKIDQLSTRQRYDHLPLIDGTPSDVFLSVRLPLIDTLVSLNVANALRINLYTENQDHMIPVIQCIHL